MAREISFIYIYIIFWVSQIVFFHPFVFPPSFSLNRNKIIPLKTYNKERNNSIGGEKKKNNTQQHER